MWRSHERFRGVPGGLRGVRGYHEASEMGGSRDFQDFPGVPEGFREIVGGLNLHEISGAFQGPSAAL